MEGAQWTEAGVSKESRGVQSLEVSQGLHLLQPSFAIVVDV